MVPITTQCPHCRAGGLSGMFCNNCRRYVSDATGTVERVTYTRRYFGDGWLGSISFIIMIATFPLGTNRGLNLAVLHGERSTISGQENIECLHHRCEDWYCSGRRTGLASRCGGEVAAI